MTNMGLRESVNHHKGLTAGAVIGGILVLALVMVWQFGLSTSTSGASGTRGGLFFTTDDGATTFTAPANMLPPFDHKGKEAVQAVMFSTDGGKTKFVGYLERYTVEAKKQMEKPAVDASKPGARMVMTAPTSGFALTEVKKPGDKAWVSKSSVAGVAITRVTPPAGGGTGAPEIVTP